MVERLEGSRPQESFVEKRRHVRVEAKLAVTCTFVGDSVSTSVCAATRDISHGGACVEISGCADELFRELAALPRLEIAFDNESAAHFEGCVEWVRLPTEPGGSILVGLEFCNLSAADETLIIDIIAQVLIAAREPLPGESSPRELQPTLSI